MELQRLKDRGAGRFVGFDLLKQWIANSLHRQIRDTSPPGCPWQSLAMACQECGCHLGDGDEDLETAFRRVLVQVYASLEGEKLDSVLEAKLSDELSLFHGLQYAMQQAKELWKWYLYCLTFHSSDFSSDGQSWNKLPRSNVVVARLPVDTVDLCVLARALAAQITVSRLDQPALRLLPHGRDADGVHCLHLVVHKGLWAPALSTLDWVSCRIDRVARVGSIVEIHDNLPSHIEGFAGLTGCVIDFDETESCYTVCSGLRTIPLQSDQIRRVLRRSSDLMQRASDISHECMTSNTESSQSGYLPSEAPALNGIPDSSLEFQLLLQMVVSNVGKRLHNKREQLAGRPVRTEALLEEEEGLQLGTDELDQLRQRPPKPGEPCPSCLSLSAVEQLLNSGAQIWTRCPSVVQRGGVQLKRQEFVCLVAANADQNGSLLFRARTAANQQILEVESDCLCLWVAAQDFQPDPKWSNPRQFLRVWQGESLVMVERHKWDGWGRMRRLHERAEDVGLVPLKYLMAHVWIARLVAA